MKVGILGSGDVGRALGRGFVTLGHDVKMGAREPGNAKAKEWVSATGPKASAGTFADAAAFGDLLVLATLGSANESVIRAADVKNFSNKVVIDATNPLDHSSGTLRLYVGHTDSLGEQVQRWIPEAHVVKAFNTVGNALMFQPQFPEGRPDMFIAGNQDAAKRAVGGILKDFGWGVADLGGIEASRQLEEMCMVWCLYGFKSGGWNHAFKLLRK
jgi:predicted dinucleotide-binding enzyme